MDEGVHDEEESDDVDAAIGEKLFEVPAKHVPHPNLGGVEHLSQQKEVKISLNAAKTKPFT